MGSPSISLCRKLHADPARATGRRQSEQGTHSNIYGLCANLLRSLSMLLGTLVEQPEGPRTVQLHKEQAATSVWLLCTHVAHGQAKA